MRRDLLKVLEIHGNEDLLQIHSLPIRYRLIRDHAFVDFKSSQEIARHLQEIAMDFQEPGRAFNAFQEKIRSSRRQNANLGRRAEGAVAGTDPVIKEIISISIIRRTPE